jgi:hypothetical protein
MYIEVFEMNRPRNMTASARLALPIPISFMDSSPIFCSRIMAYSGKIFIADVAVGTSKSAEAAEIADKSRSDPVRDNCTSAAEEGNSPWVEVDSASAFVTTDNSSSGAILRSRARA